MPSEVRRLVFSNNELSAALAHYGKMYDIHFPDGKIIKVTLAQEDSGGGERNWGDFSAQYNVEDGNANLIITFFNESNFEHKMFSVTSDFVSGALIQHCLDNNVPIPRRSRKKLDVTGFNACLDITIDGDEISKIQLAD